MRVSGPTSYLLVLSASLGLAGCEIIASFDRDQIKLEEPDVTTLLSGDGEVLGGGRDAAVLDGGLFDGSSVAPDPDEDAAQEDAAEDAAVGEEDASAVEDAETDVSDADVMLDATTLDDASVTDAAGDVDASDGASDMDAADGSGNSDAS